MATRIIMPKLGMAMKEGVLGKWVKGDGESVQPDETIAIIVTKKITYELKASVAGILRHQVRAKENRPVGAVIGYILAEGEALPVEEVKAPSPAEEMVVTMPLREAAAKELVPETLPAQQEPGSFVVASPAARRLAREAGIDLIFVAGSGPECRVTETDVRTYLEQLEEVLITSSARKLAQEHCLDITRIPGSGPGGRITEEDVHKHLAVKVPQAVPAPIELESLPETTARLPLTGMRQMIAEHMMNSLQQSAQVTLITEVDVTELVKLREHLKADLSLTYTDLLIKAAAKTLMQYPRLNSTLIGDDIILLSDIHIGMAVALEEGLIVPVIFNANDKNLEEISIETQRLAKGAREGTLTVDEVSGSTFTMTNLGAFGIDYFTPIINMPEVAILGVGRIIERPAYLGDQIYRRSFMGLSLTIDHRIIDGSVGAEFLRDLGNYVSKPYRLLR